MQLQLIFTNERRVLPGIGAFTRETLRQYPFDDATIGKLADCVLAAAANAIDHAYPAGEAGEITLTVSEDHQKVVFTIRDSGLPQDVDALERRLQESGLTPGAHSLDWPGLDAVDEIHSFGYGREGKAIQIVKWLHDNHVADAEDAAKLTPFEEEAPLAPPQSYEVRRMRDDEALQVSQLMYRAYGNTYLNEDVYYPERVAAQNTAGTVISFVAVGDGGLIAGHYALERSQEGPVMEGGQAVVDPAHRGRGLLDRMKAAAIEEATRLELVGWYADAVSVHTRTQQSNITHGGRLACVDLAIAPKSQNFRNIAVDLPQRITCLLFFHWLDDPTPRMIYVPERHRAIIGEIYEHLEAPVEFGHPSPAAGHGSLRITLSAAAALATIRAEQLGGDTAHLIRHAKREIVERSHAEAIYVDLPLNDPATPAIAEALEDEGFGLLGVAPCFAPRGDDFLRLAYLVEPLKRDAIKTADEFTGRLVDYVLAEQERVQAAL